jgi:hypothetical protein
MPGKEVTNDELENIYINYLYNVLLKYHVKIKELIEKITKNGKKKGGGVDHMLIIILILAAQTFPIFAIQSENIDRTAISKSSVAQYKYHKENADWCNAAGILNVIVPDPDDNAMLDKVVEEYNNKFTSGMCKMFVSDKELRIASAMNTGIEGAIKDQISIAFGEMSLPQEIYTSLEILGNNGLTTLKDILYETIYNIFTSITNTKDETAKTMMIDYFNGVMKKMKRPLIKFANEIANSDEFIPQNWVSGALYTVPSWFWNDNREITQTKMSDKTENAFSNNNEKLKELFTSNNVDTYITNRSTLLASALYKMPTLQQTKLLQLLVNLEFEIIHELELEVMNLTYSKDVIINKLKDSVSLTTARLKFTIDTTNALLNEANILKDIASGRDQDDINKNKDSSTIFSLFRGIKDIYDICNLIFNYANANGIVA